MVLLDNLARKLETSFTKKYRQYTLSLSLAILLLIMSIIYLVLELGDLQFGVEQTLDVVIAENSLSGPSHLFIKSFINSVQRVQDLKIMLCLNILIVLFLSYKLFLHLKGYNSDRLLIDIWNQFKKKGTGT